MTENRSARPSAADFRLNWAAVSALASAAAVVVALIAYLAPQAPPPPPQPDAGATTPAAQSPSPDPVTTRPEPPTSSPARERNTPQPPEPSRTRVAPVPSPLLSAVQPGGCDTAATALTAYRRNAGATRSSQAAAAQQTYRDLMGASLDAQGMAGTTIRRLAAEFQELTFRLTGMTGGDPNQVIADINADAAELRRLCEAG
jgi:hypothetical protein